MEFSRNGGYAAADSPYDIDYASFDSTISVADDPVQLSAEAQCLVDVVTSLKTKKQRLQEIVDDIADAQKIIDASFPEFEDVKARVDDLTTKYSSSRMNFDELRDKIQDRITVQRARLRALQPERDDLAADIGMIEKTLASVTKPSNTCSICYENEVNIALRRCGHVFCNSCREKFSDSDKCPKCRTHNQGYLKLYF